MNTLQKHSDTSRRTCQDLSKAEQKTLPKSAQRINVLDWSSLVAWLPYSSR